MLNENTIKIIESEMIKLRDILFKQIDLDEFDKLTNEDFYEKFINVKNISTQLKSIEKIIYEEEQPIKKFDDIKFENLVEKIIIGEKDIDGNVNPNIVRFVLKIGTDYKFDNLSFVANKKTRVK